MFSMNTHGREMDDLRISWSWSSWTFLGNLPLFCRNVQVTHYQLNLPRFHLSHDQEAHHVKHALPPKNVDTYVFPYFLIKIHNFVLYKYYNRNRQIDGGYWYYFESQFKVTIIYILLWASSFLSCFYTSVWFLDFCSFSFTITLSSSTGPHLLPLHHHFSVPSAWIQSSTSMTTAITLYCTSYFTTPIWITNHHWLNTKYLNRSSHLYHNYHHHNTLWQHNRKWWSYWG